MTASQASHEHYCRYFDSCPPDKTLHDALAARLIELDGQLIAIDLCHPARAELLMDDAVTNCVTRAFGG